MIFITMNYCQAKSCRTYPDTNGDLVPTQPLAPNYSGCGHLDPDHSYRGGRTEFDTKSGSFGMCDGWLIANSNDVYSIGYYGMNDVPVLGQLATNWTVCDHYFAAIMAETQPNRIYQHAAQTDSLTNRGGSDFIPIYGNPVELPTIWDQLNVNGVTGGYYHAGFFTALQYWGPTKYFGISHSLDTFYEQCAAGTLPQVSFVDPILTTDDQSPGNDDHPFANIRDGERFLANVYNHIVSSPNWSNTVLIINFDEWGGFFDHVVPPKLSPEEIPPGEQAAYQAVHITPTDPTYGLRGFRVPCLVISPWSRGGRVASGVYDHASVLKLIEDRWGLTPLTSRDRLANSLAEVLDFQNPNPTPPPQIGFTNLIGVQATTTNVSITFDPAGYKLQSLSLIDGPWIDVPITNSPYTVPFGFLPVQFFRVVKTCP